MDRIKSAIRALQKQEGRGEETAVIVAKLPTTSKLLKQPTLSAEDLEKTKRTFQKGLLAVYRECLMEGLQYSNAVISYIHETKIVLTNESGTQRPAQPWQDLETSLLSGILDFLEKANTNDQLLVADALYPTMAQLYFSLPSNNIQLQSGSMLSAAYKVLCKSVQGNAKNATRLRTKGIGSRCLGLTLSHLTEYIAIESCLDLFASLIPLRQGGFEKRGKFMGEVFHQSLFNCSRTIIEHLSSDDHWNLVSPRIIGTLAASRSTFVLKPSSLLLSGVGASEAHEESAALFLDSGGNLSLAAPSQARQQHRSPIMISDDEMSRPSKPRGRKAIRLRTGNIFYSDDEDPPSSAEKIITISSLRIVLPEAQSEPKSNHRVSLELNSKASAEPPSQNMSSTAHKRAAALIDKHDFGATLEEKPSKRSRHDLPLSSPAWTRTGKPKTNQKKGEISLPVWPMDIVVDFGRVPETHCKGNPVKDRKPRISTMMKGKDGKAKPITNKRRNQNLPPTPPPKLLQRSKMGLAFRVDEDTPQTNLGRRSARLADPSSLTKTISNTDLKDKKSGEAPLMNHLPDQDTVDRGPTILAKSHQGSKPAPKNKPEIDLSPGPSQGPTQKSEKTLAQINDVLRQKIKDPFHSARQGGQQAIIASATRVLKEMYQESATHLNELIDLEAAYALQCDRITEGISDVIQTGQALSQTIKGRLSEHHRTSLSKRAPLTLFSRLPAALNLPSC